MVVTLTGENSFALSKVLGELVGTYTAEHGDLELERLDGETANPDRVREALTAMPFLTAKKMLVLRTPGANKQLAEQAEQLFGDVSETTDVIIVEPKLDKRLSYYKFLKNHTDFREFPEVDQHGLAAWLVNTAKDRGGSLSLSDARYLVDRTASNQQALANELEKLLLYEPKVTRATIDMLTDAAPQSTIFQLLEAAFAGDRSRALRLYAEQRAQNVEPAQVVAMLAWQLHVLAIIKTGGERRPETIAKEAKINPFVVQKSRNIANGLSFARLKGLIDELLAIDIAIKRTGLDTDEALQHYLLRLAA